MSIWSEMRENEWNCKVSKEIKMNEVSTILTDWTQLKPWNFHYFQWISLRSDSQSFAWDCFLTTRRLCTENLRTLVTVLWRSRRSHGAKRSKSIEKLRILAFQRCENAHFGAERRNPIKTWQNTSGTYPNRPSRFEWTAKIRQPFNLCGPSPQKSGLVEWWP